MTSKQTQKSKKKVFYGVKEFLAELERKVKPRVCWSLTAVRAVVARIIKPKTNYKINQAKVKLEPPASLLLFTSDCSWFGTRIKK